MYYEINVAKIAKDRIYKHFFATAKRSITDKDKAVEVLKTMMEKFPEPEYNITVNYHSEGYTGCDAQDFIKNPDIL